MFIIKFILPLFDIFLCSYFYIEKYIVVNNEENRIGEMSTSPLVHSKRKIPVLVVYLEIYQPRPMAPTTYYFYRLIKRYCIKSTGIYVKYIHKTFYSLE